MLLTSHMKCFLQRILKSVSPSDSMRPDSWTKCTRRPRDPCRGQSTHTEPLIHSK
uniref:Uncharacterized protein n=1 Tax=Astatotilapia calliptera TaxID=8154 RepID=A0AAX7UED9_ASTCA